MTTVEHFGFRCELPEPVTVAICQCGEDIYDYEDYTAECGCRICPNCHIICEGCGEGIVCKSCAYKHEGDWYCGVDCVPEN